MLELEKKLHQCRVLLCVLWVLSLSQGISGTTEGLVDSKQPPNSTIIPYSPQFVVKLPDKNLLCFSVEGYELFTYNLITSSYLVLNGFLRVAESGNTDPYSQTRGFGDIGVIVKAIDKRVRGGKRFFKHLIYGEKKKAIMEGFGEMDLNKGAIAFSLQKGHSNIESQQSPHEKFRISLDKPKADVLAVSSNGHTFNVYVEDGSGLVGIDTHGLIGELSKFSQLHFFHCILYASGQFYHPRVRISSNYKELHLYSGRVVAVEEGLVWDSVTDGDYVGQRCWYPVAEESVIEGEPWQYVVEHIMSISYKYSQFSRT